ncbi:MAG: aminopeptidase [Candidatus Pacearchaeota archaeon]|nr:aminopeptidase [Candidatus Pacearchaeota archaeon]
MPVDLRTRKLAQLAVKYSVFVKPGEQVAISGSSEAEPFIVELYKAVILAGGIPVLRMSPSNITDFYYKYASKQQLKHFPQHWFDTVKSCQKYMGISTESNTRELSSADSKKIALRQKITNKITDYIVNGKPAIYRVTIAYPCQALAQEAEMSLTEWENFVYQACLQDWPKLSKKLHKINSKFKENSKVHIIGENVDLKMRVHGSKSEVDDGKENMPGGEIFMAPVRESLNGFIKFEYPAIRDGKEVTGIFLKFKDGKVIESKADKNEDFLKAMLATDENSSYVGELGIGCNPRVNRFVKSLLFDEKISGTIHLALGMAYKENGGGNDSAIHWDIVKDMKKAKIVVDGKIIQENGIWRI